jgi:hypothetical protein
MTKIEITLGSLLLGYGFIKLIAASFLLFCKIKTTDLTGFNYNPRGLFNFFVVSFLKYPETILLKTIFSPIIILYNVIFHNCLYCRILPIELTDWVSIKTNKINIDTKNQCQSIAKHEPCTLPALSEIQEKKASDTYLKAFNTKITHDEELCIATSARYSYFYAADILKGPFPLGEKSIATSVMYSYFYAKNVLKGRFILGEEAIAKNAHYSYYYARDVLNGPFPLGEKIIATNAFDSYEYAKDILKGPFKLGETAIAKYAANSYYYAKDVLKGRFILGEAAIATAACYSYFYARDVLKGSFPLGEKAIAKSDYYSEIYKKIAKS